MVASSLSDWHHSSRCLPAQDAFGAPPRVASTGVKRKLGDEEEAMPEIAGQPPRPGVGHACGHCCTHPGMLRLRACSMQPAGAPAGACAC